MGQSKWTIHSVHKTKKIKTQHNMCWTPLIQITFLQTQLVFNWTYHVFWRGPCCSSFSVLYCPINVSTFPRSVLGYPLRVPHKNDIRFVVTSQKTWYVQLNTSCVCKRQDINKKCVWYIYIYLVYNQFL
jgi:hypothetical protein